MKIKKPKGNNELIKMENFLETDDKINIHSKTFEKIMFIYSVAIKELKNKMEIMQDEYKILYDYDLIDHINTRIKSPESIEKKMSKRNIPLQYKNMIEEINDIAGIRVICPLKKDIYSIKEFIENIPGLRVIKEKDYITNPKKSGYTSYHLIVEVPISLSRKLMYVKVEIQIRTMAMDFWASLEHKMKYKPKTEISKSASKELVSYAKMIQKLDQKMMILSSKN